MYASKFQSGKEGKQFLGRRREISSETILAQLLRLGTSFPTAFREPLVIAQAAEMSKVKIIIWDHNRYLDAVKRFTKVSQNPFGV